MWQLHQFPLCPFSRKVRLLLSEKGVPYELWRENPWEGRDEFLALNPAGRTPVLHDPAKGLTLVDSRAICEYFEETVDRSPMINGTAANRAEIRRLVALFDENFFGDVTAPMLHERMKKRLIYRQSPDSRVLREAMKLAHEHLYYIDHLIDHRPWLAGPTMSLADLAAAAAAPQDGFHKIEFDEDPGTIFLDAGKVEEQKPALARDYGIPSMERL